jgi:hypothetical protein
MRLKPAINLLFILSLAACGSPSLSDNARQTQILGHGGLGFHGTLSGLIPNSKASLQEAILQGYQGVETDVQLSLDRQLVLFHDEFLEHASNCDGLLALTTWEDMSNCTYNGLLSNDDDKLWSLDSLMTFCSARGVQPWISLDVKLYGSDDNRRSMADSMAEALEKALTRWEGTGRFIVESRSPEFLTGLSRKRPKCLLFYTCANISEGLSSPCLSVLDGLCLNIKDVDSSGAEAIREAGLKLMIWGATNKSENYTALGFLPDFLQTDDGGILDDLENLGGDGR